MGARIQANFISILAGLALLAIGSQDASAGTRSSFFTHSARNSTVDGIPDPTNSSCVITLTNPSNQLHNYTLQINASASGTEGAGPASFADCTNGTTCTATSTPGSFTCNGTLAEGASVSCTFSYPQYRARPTVTSGNQTVSCSGSVVATDNSNVGFVIASGTLSSFTEAGKLERIGSTGPSSFYSGQYKQQSIPISINGGKPF